MHWPIIIFGMHLQKTVNPTSYNDTRLSAALPNSFFLGTWRENSVHTTLVLLFLTFDLEPWRGKGDS